jgi:hypothetical protein
LLVRVRIRSLQAWQESQRVVVAAPVQARSVIHRIATMWAEVLRNA